MRAIAGKHAHWAFNDLLVRALRPDAPAVAVALEELRLAEARLERRRATTAGPSALERTLLRHAMARADAGAPATPSELADLAGFSRPKASVILRRLEAQDAIRIEPHATDGRRRIVVPVSRIAHLDGEDRLTDEIRAVAARLTPDEAAALTAFVREICRIVDSAEQS